MQIRGRFLSDLSSRVSCIESVYCNISLHSATLQHQTRRMRHILSVHIHTFKRCDTQTHWRRPTVPLPAEHCYRYIGAWTRLIRESYVTFMPRQQRCGYISFNFYTARKLLLAFCVRAPKTHKLVSWPVELRNSHRYLNERLQFVCVTTRLEQNRKLRWATGDFSNHCILGSVTNTGWCWSILVQTTHGGQRGWPGVLSGRCWLLISKYQAVE